MPYVKYLLLILGYILYVMLFYYLGSGKVVLSINCGHRLDLKGNSTPKTTTMMALALLFGYYSLLVTRYPYQSDRLNYMVRFTQHYDKPWSIGFNLFADFLHCFTNNEKVLFFVVSAVVAFTVLVAYRIYGEKNEKALLLLALSDYLIFSFSGLKQAMAMAFGVITIVLILKSKKVLSILFCIIAILFHESALIIIPVIIICWNEKKRTMKTIISITIIVTLFAFSSISSIGVHYISNWAPSFYDEISGYLDDTGAFSYANNILVTLKGFPFYVTLFWGIKKRNSYRYLINHYDELLIITLLFSTTMLLSMYMYWFKRLSLYGYFTIFYFASKLFEQNKKGRASSIPFYIIVLSLSLLTIRYLFQIFFLYGGF